MSLIIGVDEVGRGPLAGPVVTCAVLWPDDHGIDQLADSKKLSPKKREALVPLIREKAQKISYGRAEVEEIDSSISCGRPCSQWSELSMDWVT